MALSISDTGHEWVSFGIFIFGRIIVVSLHIDKIPTWNENSVTGYFAGELNDPNTESSKIPWLYKYNFLDRWL